MECLLGDPHIPILIIGWESKACDVVSATHHSICSGGLAHVGLRSEWQLDFRSLGLLSAHGVVCHVSDISAKLPAFILYFFKSVVGHNL
jgi:hypothetical protein